MVGRARFRLGLGGLVLIALMSGRSSGGFSILDLGAIDSGGGPGSLVSGATAVNASGGTAGISAQAGFPSVSMAVVSASGGSFAAAPVPSNIIGSSYAYAINAAGNVGGGYFTSNPDGTNYVEHAFVVRDGKGVDLGTLDRDGKMGKNAQVNGLNNGGQATGTAYDHRQVQQAFRVDGGGTSLTLINPLTGGQFALGNGINQAGIVVGASDTSHGSVHAFTAIGLVANDLTAKDPSLVFTGNSSGMAINDSGQVAGYGSLNPGINHAFLTDASGHLADLGVLANSTSSYARGLNNLGQAVGFCDNNGSGAVAFAYDPAQARMLNLYGLLDMAGRSAWRSLSIASGINDSDQISGQGVLANGRIHGFLLSPIPGQPIFYPPLVAVPTPPALVLSGLGCGIALAWSRFRRGRTGGRGAA